MGICIVFGIVYLVWGVWYCIFSIGIKYLIWGVWYGVIGSYLESPSNVRNISYKLFYRIKQIIGLNTSVRLG